MAIGENASACLDYVAHPPGLAALPIDARKIVMAAPLFIEAEQAAIMHDGAVKEQRELLVRPCRTRVRVGSEVPLEKHGEIGARITHEHAMTEEGGRGGVGKIARG